MNKQQSQVLCIVFRSLLQVLYLRALLSVQGIASAFRTPLSHAAHYHVVGTVVGG